LGDISGSNQKRRELKLNDFEMIEGNSKKKTGG
jgi:hypothetical protein